ncbi:hypothetical protein BO83DRAFT_310430 [Aspergillus eucalypticola CBS 122712]|uniref:Acetyltransferase n=1 Tax=Aspergillus eucalypticola (strain CBS 122712 / IBT 29274) TaxID=1448314 RepID=A0A317VP13_ASPEC|nr:uncharacterized protein BO83DRAFT_310430 [Aspergillus eucalypticola CBS 122712]PWY75655.1 hypothetical protein BO83DRAFT_310430 [Aspergillus eucalypticola CBS 122712]
MAQHHNTRSITLDTPPSFEPFTLSPLDHIVPPIHLFAYLTFKPDSPSDAIPVLQNGILRLLHALPFLSGNIVTVEELNGKQNSMQITPADASTFHQSPMLKVVHHAAKTSAVEGDDAQHANFVPIPIHLPNTDPSPVLRFQANVMTDGLVLCVTFNHRMMDGLGVVAIFDSLAACCRGDSAFTGMTAQLQKKLQLTSMRSSTPYNIRDEIKAEPKILSSPKSRKFALSSEKISMLKQKCNSMFSTTSGQTLKPNLTNLDILTALIWISVARAKQALSPTTPKDTPSTLSCVVDIRSILRPKLGTYIGNALMRAKCVLSTRSTSGKTPDPIADISLIHEVALQIRNEIRSITTEQATSYVSHINTLDDWSSLQAQRPELVVSSIRHFNPYGLNHGTVLGPVVTFDIPDPRLNGVCWIMPARPGSGGAKKTPLWEVRIVLEEPVMECLKREPLFCWASDISRTISDSKL